MQRYLRVAGVVGQPRVWNMRARMRGRIRGSADARWMPLRAEQHNVFDEPARLFYLTATMLGVPADGYHRFVGAAATMRVKAAGLVPVQQLSGDEMTQAETVALFNAMCLMAPATLIDPAIIWSPLDGERVRATFTNAGHTIRADLVVGDTGEQVNARPVGTRPAATTATSSSRSRTCSTTCGRRSRRRRRGYSRGASTATAPPIGVAT